MTRPPKPWGTGRMGPHAANATLPASPGDGATPGRATDSVVTESYGQDQSPS